MVSFLISITSLLIGFACLLFVISIILGRNDIADIAWGPGIALTSWTVILGSAVPIGFPHILFLSLISLWAIRLGMRIYLKNFNKPEDKRYAKWREDWDAFFYPRSFLQVFVLQCLLMGLLATVAISAAGTTAGNFEVKFVTIGLIVWLIGFCFEVVGDYQLDTFLKDKKNEGKLMTKGLWRYTRHPNYFGEITMWWGLWLMLVGTPYMLFGLISPVTITILIVFVSGIPMLEKLMEKHKDWAAYKKNTSALIPLPPGN